MIKKLLTTAFMTCVTLAIGASLIPDMKFKRLDTSDGLSNSQVNCIFKDSRGYVWIGTPYGLNRYDGYRIKTFFSNKRDTTSIRDNYVDKIFEAYDGRLWLKQGMNYCIYDPVTEHFQRDVMAELWKFGIKGSIDRLHIDSRKRFWVKVHERGLYIYNPYTKDLKEIKAGYNAGELSPQYAFSTFAECGHSMIITTTNGELVCINSETGGISWQNKWVRRHCGIENQEYKLTVNGLGDIWLRVLDRSFVYIQKEKRWFTSFKNYLQSKGITDLPEKLQVWDVLFDKNGWLWLATDHEGILVIDVKGRQVKQFKNNKYDVTSLSDNTARQFYQAPDGQVWVATYKNGINQYRGVLSYFNTLEMGDINTVTVDRQGNYWMGSNDDGIIVYDPQTGETLHHFTTENSALSSNIMVGSCTASDGSIWFGSYNGGLVRCMPAAHPSQSVIVNYRSTNDTLGLSSNNVWGVTEDRWKRIWLCSVGGGLQRLDLKTGVFRTWNTGNSKIKSDYITSVGWIKKGWLIAGTTDYYTFVNPLTGKIANRAIPETSEITVNTANTNGVIEDSRGLIWQGSASGVTVYDQETQFVRLLDMSDGLLGSSVCSVVEDQQHAVWVVTDHGVSKIQPLKQDDGTWQFIVRSYNARDGLQNDTYNKLSASVTPDGLLLIGGLNGVDVINPKNLGSSKSNERPLFSGLLLFDREVAVGEEFDGRVILDEAIGECSELDLRHTENNFTIQLGSDAGVVQNDKRFVYMLEGFRDNWVKTADHYPNISFMSLHYGDYKLRVRMMNDDGTMGEQEATLDIHIAPPFWRTRLAQLIYLLLVIGGVWWWRRWFIRHQRERMEIDKMRRELEKQQWISEHMQDMNGNAHGQHQAPKEPEVITLQPAEADIVSFIRQKVENFKSTEKHSVRPAFSADFDVLTMSFDPEQLGRLLDILVGNAIKFSPSDSRVKVHLSELGNMAEIRVSDRGLGIPEEARARLFDASVDPGIGLDIVKQITEAHGGSVYAEDNPQGGTIFVVRLPK